MSRDDDYTAYLQLDQLLAVQTPLSDPPHHDEKLFIIQHQVAELWIKLLIHEVDGAIRHMQNGRLAPAIKNLERQGLPVPEWVLESVGYRVLS